MGWWFEAWTLPHTGSFVRKHAAIPVQGWSFDRNIDKTREQLTITVPRSAALLADLITVDPDDHTNDVASLIRVYRSDVVDGSGDPRPVAEFLASRRADQAGDTATDTVDITCKGITSVLDHPVVYPFDYPATPTAQADWLYGAPSDLTNGSFENNDTVAEIAEVWTDATGGTFTLSMDGGTTSAIAYNASTTDIDTAVTAALVAAGNTSPQVEVSGTGTEEDPWRIEYVSPYAVVPSTTADGTSLTGGSITVTTPTQGRQEPAGWTLATHGVTGEPFGTYGPDPLEILTSPGGGPDGAGGLALLVDVDSQFGGVQTVPIPVVGGEQRRASAWIRTPDSGQRFVLVVRGAYDERFVARTADITPIADTWAELAVDAIVPDDLTHVVVRVSYVGTVNPSPFWVDEVTTAAGAPAATVGRIWLDLLADIQTDHASDPRGAFLTWITPTFTESVDSNGVAWQGSHSVTVPEGATYLQFAEQILDRFGYELSVDWNPATGEHELNVYNPAGLGDTITGHAIVVGGNAIAGENVRSEPSGTAVFVRGANDRWRETKNAEVETVWERRERHVRARDVATNGDLDQIADETLTDLLDAMTGLQYQMSDHGQTVPIRDFDAGDTIHVQPGTSAGIPANTRRVTAIKVSGLAGQATGLDVHVTSEVLGSLGLTAQAEAVRRLIRRLTSAQPADAAAVQFFDPRIGGGETVIPWLVAGANANNDLAAIAGATVADGVDGSATIQTILDTYSECWVTGYIGLNTNATGLGYAVRLAAGRILGLGYDNFGNRSNLYQLDTGGTFSSVRRRLIDMGPDAFLENVWVSTGGSTNTLCVALGLGYRQRITGCRLSTTQTSVPAAACYTSSGAVQNLQIVDTEFWAAGGQADSCIGLQINAATIDDLVIERCNFIGGGGTQVDLSTGTSMHDVRIQNNRFEQAPSAVLQLGSAAYRQVSIVDNTIVGGGANLASFATDRALIKVAGGTTPDATIDSLDEVDILIARNRIRDGAFLHGIWVDAVIADILDNMIVDVDGRGIWADDAPNSTIARNTIIGAGATYDAIRADGSTSYADIYSNKVRASCANGINIVGASATANRVYHNALGGGTYTGLPIADTGTSTELELPTGGSYGSNWT